MGARVSPSVGHFRHRLLASSVVSCGPTCIYFGSEAFLITFPSFFVVPSDLTAEERQELENIRRRKQELLADIQVGAGQHLDQGSSHDAF